MNTTWKYVKPLENEFAVKDYLKKYHICLPDYLVSIMERYNGGRPEEKQIVTSENREYVFKALLSYNKKDRETIYEIYPELFGKTSLYPIGSDAAGNFICYDTDALRFVLYNHETEDVEIIKNNLSSLFGI